MDPNQAPTLEHGIPDPETYLPETPEWYWWFLIGGIVLTILALLWLLKILFGKPRKAAAPKEHDFFTPAMRCLDSLEADSGKRLISGIAADASLAIRTYLAGSRSEPALYETAEEFQARQSILPAAANQLLNDLNDVKYSKSEVDHDRATALIHRSRTCLEDLRRFAPVTDHAKVPSPALPAHSEPHWFGRLIIKRSLAGVPLGIILALSGLLGGTYQRRHVGPEVQGNALVWVGLSVSAIALLIYLIARLGRSRR